MLETDAQALVATINHDFPDDPAGDPWAIAGESPAARIIDCVVSLRRSYDKVCLPRVQAFIAKFPNVISSADLVALIAAAPDRFGPDILEINSSDLGPRILKVAEYLVEIQRRFTGAKEEQRLRAWALWARPGDYLALDIHRFGLAGFQYLRMLFGADTAKPDVHIIRYVSAAVGRDVCDAHALYILERAGELSGRSVRRLDNVIWERGARGR